MAGDVARMWLSTQLMARGLPPVSEFFATIRLTKPSRTILPLFFGQADACIVSESALAVMIELNPQINRKIKLLDRSPKFVNLLVCGTKNISDVNTQRLHEEIEILSNTSDGQQALTIIQMKRFFEFDPEYLRATEALFNRHRQIDESKKVNDGP